MEKNLTEDHVLHTILYFSLPYLLSYFLQTLYGNADLFIIGQFCGVESTTAVSIGSQVMHMITVMIVGLAMGTTVMIGRAVGARKRSMVNQVTGNTITLFAGTAILLTCILLFCIPGITSIMAVPQEALAGTQAYLKICFIGIPFITAYNIISSIFRGMGDSRSPMYFIAIACVFNILFDYLFIGKMGMAAAGAALGTVLAQTISVITALAAIMKKKMIPGLKAADLRPDRQTMRSILSIGLPVMVQDGFIQVSFIVITIFANLRGLNDAAAVGVVEKLIGILFLVPSTMLSTVSALCAQNIGAGKHDRAKETLRYSLLICVVFGIVISILMQFFSEPAVSLFTDSEDVIRLGGQYMRSYCFDCIFAGMHFCFSGYFCAYGFSVISFIHNACSIILARIPIAWYTSSHCASLTPMGFSAPAGSCLSVIICLIALRWLNSHPEQVALHLNKDNQ